MAGSTYDWYKANGYSDKTANEKQAAADTRSKATSSVSSGGLSAMLNGSRTASSGSSSKSRSGSSNNSGGGSTVNFSGVQQTPDGYLYNDDYGFQHVVKALETALKYSGNGNVYTYNGAMGGGYARDAEGNRAIVNGFGSKQYGNDVKNGVNTSYINGGGGQQVAGKGFYAPQNYGYQQPGNIQNTTMKNTTQTYAPNNQQPNMMYGIQTSQITNDQKGHQKWINDTMGGMDNYVNNQIDRYWAALKQGDAELVNNLRVDANRVGYSLPATSGITYTNGQSNNLMLPAPQMQGQGGSYSAMADGYVNPFSGLNGQTGQAEAYSNAFNNMNQMLQGYTKNMNALMAKMDSYNSDTAYDNIMKRLQPSLQANLNDIDAMYDERNRMAGIRAEQRGLTNSNLEDLNIRANDAQRTGDKSDVSAEIMAKAMEMVNAERSAEMAKLNGFGNMFSGMYNASNDATSNAINMLTGMYQQNASAQAAADKLAWEKESFDTDWANKFTLEAMQNDAAMARLLAGKTGSGGSGGSTNMTDYVRSALADINMAVANGDMGNAQMMANLLRNTVAGGDPAIERIVNDTITSAFRKTNNQASLGTAPAPSNRPGASATYTPPAPKSGADWYAEMIEAGKKNAPNTGADSYKAPPVNNPSLKDLWNSGYKFSLFGN